MFAFLATTVCYVLQFATDSDKIYGFSCIELLFSGLLASFISILIRLYCETRLPDSWNKSQKMLHATIWQKTPKNKIHTKKIKNNKNKTTITKRSTE